MNTPYRSIKKLLSKNKRFSYLIIILFILLEFGRELSLIETEPVPLSEGVYRVERVVDGDTLLLTSGHRLRLLGVDTPETVRPNWPVEPFGPEASAYTKAAIERANYQVRLRLDRERQDKYGRFLAFVFLDIPIEGQPGQTNEVFLNEELVRLGLGRALLTFQYSYAMKKRLANAQMEAQQSLRGIWSLPAQQQPIQNEEDARPKW